MFNNDSSIATQSINLLCDELEFWFRLHDKAKDEREKARYARKISSLLYLRGLADIDREKKQATG